jgi:DNA-binding FrmR family transcriptional regulator
MGGGRGQDIMDEDVVRRLKNVEGHVRGIEQMVENGTYCIDVIRQIQAVQAALDKVSKLILDSHLHSCVITAVRGENPDDREKVLAEIVDIFEMKKNT